MADKLVVRSTIIFDVRSGGAPFGLSVAAPPPPPGGVEGGFVGAATDRPLLRYY